MVEESLRLLMIAPTPYFADRGCHVRIYEEARALTRMGHEVCIVTYHLGRDMPGVRVVRTPAVRWYKKLEAGPSWHKPYLDLLLLLKSLAEARSFRPHLIHAHLHEGTLVGSVLKRLLNIPLLFDYQGSLTGESLNHGFFSDRSLLMKLFKSVELFINHQADHIITSSDKAAIELADDWKISPSRISNLIDAVDTDVFFPYPASEARRELCIDEGVKLVVYLGLFNSYQGVDFLLDTIATIRAKSPDIHFLLMGFPEVEYKSKAKELGIDDVITFTGRVSYERAAFFLSAGDLAVSPKLSLTEANGKLFNYMACGLPTVVFDNQINREILGDYGIYVEHGNADLLAESIISTIHDEVLSGTISIKLRERAVEVHSWKSRSEQLHNIYRKILNSR
ncbi:MAG: glycosyltransferase family 4 protein [Desulfuromonadaceae bacterium]|nr:glycosyltransferase family 4 protein [Desulfuromonadaceae bacterium]MDD2856064.1 glycosyltransferase family 4 protein [Desulfuromonadaceae bacterium]